jgi:hypothetical protein
MIHNVALKQLCVILDERGYLMEMLRAGPMVDLFSPAIRLSSERVRFCTASR